MVAKLIGLDLEIVKVARHWWAIIKRVAITEGIDKVISLLEYKVEKEEDLTREKTEIKEILMKVEVETQELTSNPNISSTMAISDIDTKDILVSKTKEATTKAIEDIRVIADTDILACNKSKINKEIQVTEETNTEKYRNSTLEESL